MSVLPVGFGSAVAGGYQIQRSLRFNSADSAYLNRTPVSTGNRRTWTWSGWVKRTTVSSSIVLFSAAGSSRVSYISIPTNNTLNIYSATSAGGGDGGEYVTSQVFRDVSAWYHIVVAYDSTQATSTNRIKAWINGTQITAWGIATAPTINHDSQFNWTGAPMLLGQYNSASYFNGYLTEINFIDGQQLDASSFGETDSATGVWKPKAYSGTYGTNGFYLPFKTASNWSGYFDGTGDYLTVPHNSVLSPTGDFTIEFWAYTGSTALQEWITKGLGIQIYNNSSNWYVALSSSNNSTYFINASFGAQTTNTWQHIAISRQGNTYRGFVNGVATTVGTSSSTPSTGTDSVFIGVNGVGTPYYVNGYISNVRIVNGTAVYTGNFTVPTAQLTAITNTSLLTCQSSTFVDNSTNGFTLTTFGDSRPQQFSPFTLDVTDDHSGQGNHWIPNNLDLRTTGVGADIMVDSPTSYGTDTGVGGEVRGNYCTLNPIDKDSSTVTLTNGNLSWASGAPTYNQVCRATIAVTTGKWYWEVTPLTNGAWANMGVANALGTLANASRLQPGGWVYLGVTGNKMNNNSSVAYGATYTNNDVIGVALDMDGNTLTFYKNGVSQGVAYSSGFSGNTISPLMQDGANDTTAAINFGQRAFAYTAPSGFKALCTQNLTYTHTIGATSTTQAGKYFDATTYSGNSSTQSVVNSGAFQPDLVWIKSRSGALTHYLNDSVRGAYKTLFSNLTNAEYDGTSNSDGVSAFNANGFTLLNGTNAANYNASGSTYVGWQWNAGGSNATNTNGSVTSTVRSNTISGFSIVTFTDPNNSSNYTVGHGCQVNNVATIPSMIIVKERGTSGNWIVWHSSATTTVNQYLFLNDTAGTGTLTNVWGAAVPTSTVFGLRSGTSVSLGDTVVAYCFAPVPGYSAFGSYTGNGDPNGPFVYTGFRPRYILVKRRDSADNWAIYDSARDTYNQASKQLRTDATTVELDPAGIPAVYYDLLSNGFKNRGSNSQCNANGGIYIYAAFAESPFKYSLAR